MQSVETVVKTAKQQTFLPIEAEIDSLGTFSLGTPLQHELMHRLQTTLDLETLLDIFSELTAKLVPHAGVSYASNALNQKTVIGINEQHHYESPLFLHEEQVHLGTLQVMRAIPFTAVECRLLDELFQQLVYPLRNALLYRQALNIAATDPLTGANNRTLFEPIVEREIKLSRRYQTPLSMICADIDHFKKVNDNYGHLAGDDVIRQVAATMKQCVRSSDILFRYGGEEFVILLTNTSLAGAELLAERIRLYTASHPCTHRQKLIPVSLSLGVHKLTDDDDINSLFQRADQAMYAAKKAGRNQVKLAS